MLIDYLGRLVTFDKPRRRAGRHRWNLDDSKPDDCMPFALSTTFMFKGGRKEVPRMPQSSWRLLAPS